jgi:hypothetical protein
VVAGLALYAGAVGTACAAIVIDVTATSNSKIHFVGGAIDATDARYFDFLPSDSAHQFTVSTSQGDLFGTFGDTKFFVGAIDGSGIALVKGTGTMTIHDENEAEWQASVGWQSIGTLGNGGSINVAGVVNMGTVNYSGSNSDLLALKNGTGLTAGLSFYFAGESSTGLLSHLMDTSDGTSKGTPNDHSTSFSGQISAVPEFSTWAAGAGALIVFLGFGWRVHGGNRRVLRIG